MIFQSIRKYIYSKHLAVLTLHWELSSGYWLYEWPLTTLVTTDDLTDYVSYHSIDDFTDRQLH